MFFRDFDKRKSGGRSSRDDFQVVYRSFDVIDSREASHASGSPELPSIAVDAFKRETDELIRRFLAHKLTYPQCLSALDTALADVHPTPTAVELALLRSLISKNNELVMQEMERRISIDHSTRPYST